MSMGNIDDPFHIVDGTEGVVHMSYADKARTRGDQSFELREHQVAVLISRNRFQRTAFLMAHLLPGHDIGMMVQL